MFVEWNNRDASQENGHVQQILNLLDATRTIAATSTFVRLRCASTQGTYISPPWHTAYL